MSTNKLGQNFSLPGLIRFTIPTIIMMVFMALYQMVDGMFVSNFVGPEALSALNIVYPAISIVVAISIMLATGGSAIIARYLGENRPKEAKESFTLICLTGLGLSIVLLVVGLLWIDPIIHALGASPAIFQYCKDYLWVLLISCPFAMFQMLFQTFMVTAGKPNLGLSVTILGGATNIALDYLLIAVLQQGVAGAAIATAAGYAVPAIFGLLYFSLQRKGAFYFVKPKFEKAIIARACSNGSSEMVTNLATAITTFLFNGAMMRFAGESGVASVTIILYSQFLLTAAFIGFSMGIAPLFSFSYGSGDQKRTTKLFGQSMQVTVVSSVAAFGISYLCAPAIVGIFARAGTPVYELALGGFHIFAFSFLFAGLNIFASALFTAFSNGLISAVISFSRTFVFLVASLLLLPLVLGVTGVWLAVPVAEVISTGISIIFLIKNRKRYGLTQRG